MRIFDDPKVRYFLRAFGSNLDDDWKPRLWGAFKEIDSNARDLLEGYKCERMDGGVLTQMEIRKLKVTSDGAEMGNLDAILLTTRTPKDG